MKACRWPCLAWLSLVALCGCKHYDYFLVEPTQFAQQIGPQPVTVRLLPLEYRMAREHNRVAINIDNPTEQTVEILGNKSYLVAPTGSSHPLAGRPIAPHSFVPLALPPVPLTYQVYAPYSTYRSPWWWSPYRYPYAYNWYGGWYDPYPMSYSVQVLTPHDWTWREGPVRLRLSYEHEGKPIEHNFLFERRLAK